MNLKELCKQKANQYNESVLIVKDRKTGNLTYSLICDMKLYKVQYVVWATVFPDDWEN